MKKKVVAIIIFLCALVGPTLVWPIVKAHDVELNENRMPAAAPVAGNDFFLQFDDYYNDRAPMRNMMIKLHSYFDYKSELAYQKILRRMGHDKYTEINNVLVGLDDWLFFLGDDSLSYYKGTNIPDDETLAVYAERTRKVKEYFEAKGKEFVIFIAPNKNEIYDEYLPSAVRAVRNEKRLDTLAGYVRRHADVNLVYPKEELIAAKKYAQLYYKQDTHWTGAGGYYGCCELLRALGMPAADCAMSEGERHGGDLANFSALPALKDVEYNRVYRPEVTSTKTYVDNDVEKAVTVSDVGNGKTLLLLGDSFRHAMEDILAKEFEKATFWHRDVFGDWDKLEEKFDEATTVVFQCVGRYDKTLFGDGGLLERFINVYIPEA